MIAVACGPLRTMLTGRYFKDVAAGFTPLTREHYVRSLNDFERYLERPALPSDLNDGAVAAWVQWLPGKPLAPETVKKELACLLAFWRWAARKRLVSEFPEVPRYVAPEPNVVALTEAQVAALLKACAETRGHICGVVAADYWTAMCRFCLDHGERTGAVLALRWEWFDLDRASAFVPGGARKGRKSLPYPLRAWVVEALKRIEHPRREKVFPWAMDRGTFYLHFRRLWFRAGLPKLKRIGPQVLRRTHATHLLIHGGNPTESLAHSSPAVTKRYYIDKSQCRPECHAERLGWGK